MSAVRWYFPLLIMWSDLRQKLESCHPPTLITEIANGDIVGFRLKHFHGYVFILGPHMGE